MSCGNKTWDAIEKNIGINRRNPDPRKWSLEAILKISLGE